MPTLNIVLIEPQIPQNTGNIARTCAATGARLHLVGPLGFEITDTKLKRAGLDYWHLLDITTYPSSAAFLRKMREDFIISAPKHSRPIPSRSIRTTPTLYLAGRTGGSPRNFSMQIRNAAYVCR